jgi:penicillin amidase
LRTYLNILFFLVVGLGLVVFLDRPSLFGVEGIPRIGPLLSPAQGFLQNRESTKDLSSAYFPAGVGYKNGQVVVDDHLIPHIYADDDLTAYRIQGFIEAKDRLWQMDFVTRVAAGRISEVIGPRAIDFDKKQRRKGLPESARRILSKWQTFDSYRILESYTKGVNDYISTLSSEDFPIEYKLLDFSPEAWSPYKTALFYKYMSDILCGRESDIELYNMRKILGDEVFEFLFDKKNPRAYPVIPSEVDYYSHVPKQDKAEAGLPAGSGFERPFPSKPSGIGSNNWVISPQRSVTGRAILSNDPHLNLRLPSVWYLAHICTPTHNVMGVTFPGAPGITLGFNENVAWGVTNVGHDVLDWLIVDWVERWSTYKYEDELYPIEWKAEKIKVKGQATITDSVAWSHLGPIWTLSSADGEADAIMRWLAHEVGERDDLSVFPALNHAKDLNDLVAASSNHESPAQNFAFATKDGDIAMRVQGRFPVRNEENGRFLDSLRTCVDTWDDYIPVEDVPFCVNPQQGYLASANQASTDSTYPYYYVDGDFRDERARTINNFLRSKDKLGIEDMVALQMNNSHISAVEFCDAALDLIDPDLYLYDAMSRWQGVHEAEDTLSTFFDIWIDLTYDLLFDEAAETNLEIRRPKLWRIADLAQTSPEHIVWDSKATMDKIEDAEDILTQAWNTAVEEYKKLDDKRWYIHRDSKIEHIVSAFTSFGIQEIKSGGVGPAPNALRKSQGPSWRLICEPGSGRPALGVYPGGQSGNPGSRYYQDLFPLWESGKYLELGLPKDPKEVDNALFTIQAKGE